MKKDIVLNEKRKLLIEVILLLSVLLILFLLVVYYQNNKEYKVDFVTNTSEIVETQYIKGQDKVLEPMIKKRDGYEFKGWYFRNKKYNFNTPVTSDMTLEARWSKKK